MSTCAISKLYNLSQNLFEEFAHILDDIRFKEYAMDNMRFD